MFLFFGSNLKSNLANGMQGHDIMHFLNDYHPGSFDNGLRHDVGDRTGCG